MGKSVSISFHLNVRLLNRMLARPSVVQGKSFMQELNPNNMQLAHGLEADALLLIICLSPIEQETL